MDRLDYPYPLIDIHSSSIIKEGALSISLWDEGKQQTRTTSQQLALSFSLALSLSVIVITINTIKESKSSKTAAWLRMSLLSLFIFLLSLPFSLSLFPSIFLINPNLNLSQIQTLPLTAARILWLGSLGSVPYQVTNTLQKWLRISSKTISISPVWTPWSLSTRKLWRWS